MLPIKRRTGASIARPRGRRAGCDHRSGKAFITPLSLQAVSGYPVSDSLLDTAAEAAMGHIELGKWADPVILAPATADLIARITAGMANDLVRQSAWPRHPRLRWSRP
ncbi:flavoprotein [Shigella flexneri]